MKKLLVVLLLAVSNLAFAGGAIILGVGAQENNAGPTAGTNSTDYNLKFITDVANGWDADVMFANSRNNTSAKVASQYEVGIRYKYPVIENVVVYLRPSLGAIQISGLSTQTYIGLEPGVIWRPWGGPVSAKVDYTAGTGLNTNNLDIGMTRAQVSYDFNKENSIGLRRDWMRGDLNFDVWWVSLVHRF